LPLLLFLCLGSARADLTATLDAVANSEALAQGQVGLGVYDLTRDRWLYGRQLDKLFTPASTYKLATAAFALENLGPDFRFRTRLLAQRPLDAQGALAGNLYLVGGGDPFAVAASYRKLARLAYDAGLRQVRGALALDESRFAGDNVPLGWNVDDLQHWYGARPAALNLDRQRIEITVQPTEPGRPPQVTVADHWSGVSLDNRCLTVPAGGRTEVDVAKELGCNRYRVTGTIAGDQKLLMVTRTVDDAGRFAAQVVRRELEQAGVTFALKEPVREEAPRTAVPLATVESDPLAAILTRTLKHSENLAAELLMWNTGVELGKGPEYVRAKQAQDDWLTAQGLPMAGLRTADASGLSRFDNVTPRFMIELLRFLRRSRYAALYRAALPVAGVDGTLEQRLTNSLCRGRVVAKTGWLSRVACLAGYAPRPDGSEACFVVMLAYTACPNDEALRICDAVAEAVVTAP
jgi:D-alanyl-D-alanine carboxypeptidase/D-alanyl-D-alanine-endopeptidase (penicillin-binding protein 4)